MSYLLDVLWVLPGNDLWKRSIRDINMREMNVFAAKIFLCCRHKNKTKRSLLNNWHKWFVETSPTFSVHRAEGSKRRKRAVLVLVKGRAFKSLPLQPDNLMNGSCHFHFSFQELDYSLDSFIIFFFFYLVCTLIWMGMHISCALSRLDASAVNAGFIYPRQAFSTQWWWFKHQDPLEHYYTGKCMKLLASSC